MWWELDFELNLTLLLFLSNELAWHDGMMKNAQIDSTIHNATHLEK